ncbi:dihydroxyacetone kinase [Aedoeadaptatus ivorii]|uniref:Dihydroxyacetone kinase n=1 Tax=Aedoeadaptatus ivorii TaxID=54006 RepID=A0A3S4YKS4_9FIRM|nr:DAK2 domain-containing protein [Peptoniphilus ivorii]VEJ35607.1 dihydroxyacetone kinase [Peptoniphilus ivorii]
MEHISAKAFREALISASNFLEQNKTTVNDLNVFPVPDGDTGTNMSMTIKSAVRQVESSEAEDVAGLASEMSRGALMGARGNSGVILSQLFRGFAEGLKDKEVLNIQNLAVALKKASEMTYLAVMKPTEGTILTVGRESADFAIKNAKKYSDLIEFAEAVLSRAKESLANTPNLLPVLKEAGVVDAGGQGLVTIMEGALLSLKGMPVTGEAVHDAVVEKAERKRISTDDIQFGYCTEFIVNTEEDHVEDLKAKLIERGDSLLVVGDDKMIKVHVHTNDPGLALQSGLEYGFLKDIKIDNMRIQHSERLFSETQVQKVQQEEKAAPVEEKSDGFVAICAGKGLESIFKEAGADYIVTGGQTMNPSTEDILAGIEKVSAKRVFVLPNNGNIFMAAKAAAEISKKEVVVLETRTIPEGINACIHFLPDASLEENLENMNAAIDDVRSAQITYAVRDTEMNGIEIHKDDIIGISDKKILARGETVHDTTLAVLEEMIDDDTSYVSLYAGEDVDASATEAMEEAISSAHPDLDFEILRGDQPIYYYLISVE